VYSIYVIVCDHRTFTQFDIEEPTLFSRNGIIYTISTLVQSVHSYNQYTRTFSTLVQSVHNQYTRTIGTLVQ